MDWPKCACGRPCERSYTPTGLPWRKQCAKCRRPNKASKRPYRRSKGARCERCGFIPEHPAQLDVDHADGDHSNNDATNLVTLCANCHRLKTVLAGDHLTTPVRPPAPEAPSLF